MLLSYWSFNFGTLIRSWSVLPISSSPATDLGHDSLLGDLWSASYNRTSCLDISALCSVGCLHTSEDTEWQRTGVKRWKRCCCLFVRRLRFFLSVVWMLFRSQENSSYSSLPPDSTLRSRILGPRYCHLKRRSGLEQHSASSAATA